MFNKINIKLVAQFTHSLKKSISVNFYYKNLLLAYSTLVDF